MLSVVCGLSRFVFECCLLCPVAAYCCTSLTVGVVVCCLLFGVLAGVVCVQCWCVVVVSSRCVWACCSLFIADYVCLCGVLLVVAVCYCLLLVVVLACVVVHVWCSCRFDFVVDDCRWRLLRCVVCLLLFVAVFVLCRLLLL